MSGFPSTRSVEWSFLNHTYDNRTALKNYRKYSCKHLAQFLVYSGCSNVLEGSNDQSFKLIPLNKIDFLISISLFPQLWREDWAVKKGLNCEERISRCPSSSHDLGLMQDCLSIHIPTYLWAPSGHRQFLSIQDGRSRSCVLRSCHYSDTSNWRTVWASPPDHLGHHAGTGGCGVGSLR